MDMTELYRLCARLRVPYAGACGPVSFRAASVFPRASGEPSSRAMLNAPVMEYSFACIHPVSFAIESTFSAGARIRRFVCDATAEGGYYCVVCLFARRFTSARELTSHLCDRPCVPIAATIFTTLQFVSFEIRNEHCAPVALKKSERCFSRSAFIRGCLVRVKSRNMCLPCAETILCSEREISTLF